MRRPYPPSASRQSPCGSRLWTRSTSPNICWTLLSANSHCARSVSRALVPASNCCRIRCRWASACGPSTERGVGESCMFFAGGMPGLRLGRGAVVTLIALQSASWLPGG